MYLILNKEPLLLANVEDGCIELTFRYFGDAKLFPLREAEKAALAEIGVRWLHLLPSRIYTGT